MSLNRDGRCVSCGVSLVSDERCSGDCYAATEIKMQNDNGGHTSYFSGTLKNALSWFCPFANTSIQQIDPAGWPGRHVTY